MRPQSAANVGKLIVGGAQFGLDYGIANKAGKPTKSTVCAILKVAYESGVRFIDTAQAYGDSEHRIGDCISGSDSEGFHVVTKLILRQDGAGSTSASAAIEEATEAVDRSIGHLKTPRLNTLLLHRADMLEMHTGSLWSALVDLKHLGKVERLGVSVQNPEELILALSHNDVETIQLPCNILDMRWDALSSQISKVKKSRNLEIHVRGVFLQGLLLVEDATSWKRARCSDYATVVRFLGSQASLCERSVSDLCIGFILSIPWVDRVVLGIDSVAQLNANLAGMISGPLLPDQYTKIIVERERLPFVCMDPSKWMN
jgi:aryl-alcohol dehydrogenase-like predicted oxidoreductase